MTRNYGKQVDETVRAYKRLKKLDRENALLDFIKPTPKGGYRRVTGQWGKFMDEFCEGNYEMSVEEIDRNYLNALKTEIKRIEKEKGLAKKLK